MVEQPGGQHGVADPGRGDEQDAHGRAPVEAFRGRGESAWRRLAACAGRVAYFAAMTKIALLPDRAVST